MKREEEIIKAGIDYTTSVRPMCIGGMNFEKEIQEFNRNISFEEGAKWADKTMLDRTCEWLRLRLNYVEDYTGDLKVCSFDYETVEEFITAFRQAMEGGAE